MGLLPVVMMYIDDIREYLVVLTSIQMLFDKGRFHGDSQCILKKKASKFAPCFEQIG